MAKIDTTTARAAFVESRLDSAKFKYFPLEGTNYTICVVTFIDGWSVTGQSVCVSKADYKQETGERIARENALADAETHYWRTAGYLAMIGMTDI